MSRLRIYIISTIVLVNFALLSFSACSIGEVRIPLTAVTRELPPVTIPENIVTVYCGAQTGTGFPIEKNRVVTAYHVLEEYCGMQSCTVMNYSAKLIYFDELKDVAVLETIWEFSDIFEFEVSEKLDPLIGANYRQGDSGMPLLSENGNVIAMLIGQRADKTYAIVDVRYLRTLRRDQEIEEQKKLAEERLLREEEERIEAERAEQERIRYQQELARQREVQRQEEGQSEEEPKEITSNTASDGFRRGS